jgi:imidazolonepropionase-like amidohydrolase
VSASAIFECHGHIIADGIDYRAAQALHKRGASETAVRAALARNRDCGVVYYRDGGDRLGASLLAKSVAPEYGIEYRTPSAILHRRGHYGELYGIAYRDLTEYRALVARVRAQGADFIKIAATGMLDFAGDGRVLGEALPFSELSELVRAAHGEGFAVMAHCNGADNIIAAAEAGVDSVEHGFHADARAVDCMVDCGVIWCPTCVTAVNNAAGGRFPRETMAKIVAAHADALRYAASRGAFIACGSDAGAFNVLQGRGAAEEAAYLSGLGIDTAPGNAKLREVFRAG